MEDYDISPIQSDFEQIKKLNKNGQEYWPSRDLCTALGYSTMHYLSVYFAKSVSSRTTTYHDVPVCPRSFRPKTESNKRATNTVQK